MSRQDNLRRVRRTITDEYGIEVITLTATYATDRGRRVMIMDGSEACSVEEYTRRHFNRSGYRATLLENGPIHVLFGTYMWPVLQDADDRRSRIFGSADRHAYDAGIVGRLIWSRLPADFGKPEYATRRAKQIDRHMAVLSAQQQDLQHLFDQWLGPSSDLRNYLWAHRPEHIEVARQLIDVIPADALLEILRYLIEHYWGRRAGWPDLLVYRRKEFFLLEVKSARDNLGAAQKAWIRDNHQRLQLPFRLVKIVPQSAIRSRSAAATRLQRAPS
jgi:hypothetical protein